MSREKVTYEVLKEYKDKQEQARKEFYSALYDYLLDCLIEVGFVSDTGRTNQTVKFKRRGILGKLQIESEAHWIWRIKFYPFKKDGALSQRSIYVYLPSDGSLTQRLKDEFEYVGDSNAS